MNVVVNLFVFIFRSAFEGAAGEVHLRFEEGASDPGHQEGRVGTSSVVGGFHYQG